MGRIFLLKPGRKQKTETRKISKSLKFLQETPVNSRSRPPLTC